jgi:hypothetical protein
MVKATPIAKMTDGVLLFADVSGFTALTERIVLIKNKKC